MTRVIAEGYCCGPCCPNVTDYTVALNSLSLGCELDQPEAEVEKLQPRLCGAAELQATLQSTRCKNYPAHQGIPLPPL